MQNLDLYKIVQKAHCVSASLSGVTIWWFDVSEAPGAQDTHSVLLVQLCACVKGCVA